MCPKAEVNGKEFFKWSCVLGKCKNCPQLPRHSEENSMNEMDNIHFEHCVYHTRCTNHGLLGCELPTDDRVCPKCEAQNPGEKRKNLSQKRTKKTVVPIGDFMKNCHIPHPKNVHSIIPQ